MMAAEGSEKIRTKKCPGCGKELPEESSFCPWCEKELQPPGQVTLPRRRRRLTAAVLLLLAAAAVICLYIFLQHRPKEYAGGSMVEYGSGAGKVRLILTFNRRYSENGEPMEEQSYQLPAGESAATPSFLLIRSEDNPAAAEAFAAQVKDFRVSARPRENTAAMSVFGTSFVEEGGPYWRADLEYSPETGTNDICWDLEMKNGDRIHLEHSWTCSLLPALEFHYEDTPLETVEQIRAVIGEAVAGAEADVMITLFLPPVTYTEPLMLDQHAVTIVGCITEKAQTTFTQTVTVPLRNTMYTEFYDTAFVGDGGTGVTASECVWFTNCRFSGWEIGADARDGSWIMMAACDFTENSIGFRFDSTRSTGACPTYENMVFSGNDIGVQVKNIPSQESSISFMDCLFENNGTDVEDPGGLVSGY